MILHSDNEKARYLEDQREFVEETEKEGDAENDAGEDGEDRV